MVIVQKLSALACGLHDGLVIDKKQLTDLQKRYMIRLDIFQTLIFSYIYLFIYLFLLERHQI